MTDDICLCTGLRQAAHAMTEIYDEALAPSGLKITMFRVIRRLSEAGEPTISELAGIVGLDRSSLGRNLKVLEREELVTFIGGADERSKVVQLTAQGKTSAEDRAAALAQRSEADEIKPGRRAGGCLPGAFGRAGRNAVRPMTRPKTKGAPVGSPRFLSRAVSGAEGVVALARLMMPADVVPDHR